VVTKNNLGILQNVAGATNMCKTLCGITIKDKSKVKDYDRISTINKVCIRCRNRCYGINIVKRILSTIKVLIKKIKRVII
jgi:hypothetical protein